jgi:hypothetical protein
VLNSTLKISVDTEIIMEFYDDLFCVKGSLIEVEGFFKDFMWVLEGF